MTATEPSPDTSLTLERYFRLPRLSGLALSPDGCRLVTTVADLDDDGGRYVSSLWALDPDGATPARRLTRSTEGETGPVFAWDGSLLFVSERPRPGGKEEHNAAAWRLPPGGGEPWPVASHPGGVTRVLAARRRPVVVVAAKASPSAAASSGPTTSPEAAASSGLTTSPGGGEGEADSWLAQRAARKITGVLHETLPVRQWDHERGPEEVHLFAGTLPDAGDEPGTVTELRDLTPDAGQALHEATPVLDADGTAVVTEWEVILEEGRMRVDLVRIAVPSGERTVLASRPDGAWSYGSPAVSPVDGRVACLGMSRATIDEPDEIAVFVLGAPGEEPRRLDTGDLSPGEVTWTLDGRAVLVAGDLAGHHSLLRIDVAGGGRTALTRDGAWSSPAPAPDGSVYALRSGIRRPPHPVRLDPDAGAGAPGEAAMTEIAAPGAFQAPGRVEEITVEAADGARVRAWLALPEGASAEAPAPLVLWVHGGPRGSWNDWSWRWNPSLMTARGWAVLLPDPALSTGYGLDFVRRGWGQWGGAPYTDLMAVTDAAEARDDVDGTRTAAMGGSYGGYMANWIAGHTDRFAAIVSHASIWDLEQFQPTTDHPAGWADEMGRPGDRPEFYRQWSPSTYVDAITTPMLLVHGVRDYRCPVGETVRMWTELVEHGVDARYLSFPDENHWVLKPGNSSLWYETVFAFLDHHVLGRPWRRPALL